MKSRLISIITIAIVVGVIVNLSRSIYSLWQRGSRVDVREEALKAAQLENDQLKRKLAQVESSAYIEKQAREKLNLSKEGEHVVILPQELVERYTDRIGVVAGVHADEPNYQQWWELFF